MQIGLSSLPDRAPDPTVTDPGAQTSGPGFDRLIAAAQAEADRRKAIADQSGASADQFSEQGWFSTFKAHGAEIGFAAPAAKITKDSHGQLTVLDPALRAKVLNFRNDPLVRSVMAVKRATDARVTLAVELGRTPNDAEIRASEALGAKAAAKLIVTRQATPNASAAIVAPDAAKANRALFYRPDGSPQTVNDLLVSVMKPRDAVSADADRLLAGHAAFAAPTAAMPAAPSAQTTLSNGPLPPGMTPQMAANLRARAGFASASAPPAATPKAKTAPAPPPDLALVRTTIGNLSMPGAASGPSAPTGGKIAGWRAQMTGEVTHQIEHPESVVTNAPSNVTIQAPNPAHRPPPDQYASANPVATAAPTLPAQSALAQPTSAQMLGPQLAPSSPLPSPLPPVAAAAPEPRPMVAAAPLPALMATAQTMPTTALPLLPIDEGTAPMALGNGTAPPSAPVAGEAKPEPVAAPVVVRPSRYGPGAGLQLASTSAPLNYAAASPGLQMLGLSDASSAGIRPSRYFAGSAVAAQQFASANRPAASLPIPTTLQQTGVAAYGQPAMPEASRAPLGPDGLPILPPVPGPAGLPPLTASEALQPGVAYQSAAPVGAPAGPAAPLSETALLEGTKPLDLAPAADTAAAAPAPYAPLVHKPKPRQTPARF